MFTQHLLQTNIKECHFLQVEEQNVEFKSRFSRNIFSPAKEIKEIL